MSKPLDKPIYVTQPYLPPLEEFVPYLERIWANKWLTNCGPLHQELEIALAKYLEVPHVSVFTNGTIALLVALKAQNLTGEVITTPFSFVATSHALVLNGLTPVFADIDPVTLNLDVSRVEAAITDRTTAILPVHCYGGPCDIDGMQRVADKHGLKILYDAAHAFGVRHRGVGLSNFGDLSVLSFHATKVFNTFEGGAIVCRDSETKERIDRLKNFGIVDEVTVESVATNGKMSEVQAAFGLLQLKHMATVIALRQKVDDYYRAELRGIAGITPLPLAKDTLSNYGYFPILVGADCPLSRDELCKRLRRSNVVARKYFFPLISDMPMYSGFASAAPRNLVVAKRIADQVLCLPIFPDLSREDQQTVVAIIRESSTRSV